MLRLSCSNQFWNECWGIRTPKVSSDMQIQNPLWASDIFKVCSSGCWGLRTQMVSSDMQIQNPQWDIQKHKIRYQAPKAPSLLPNWLLLFDLIMSRWASHHMDSDWEIFQNTEVNSGFVSNKTKNKGEICWGKSGKDFLSPYKSSRENRGKENPQKIFPTLNTKLVTLNVTSILILPFS
jgi:hypothetical protein